MDRDPVVVAIDDGFHNRAQTQIRISNPGKRLPIDGTGGRGGIFQCLQAQILGFAMLPAGVECQRLHHQGNPGFRIAEYGGRAVALEHLVAQRFASQRLPVRLHHRQGAGIQVAGDVELGQGTIPLSVHCKQLKQKYAVCGL